MRYFNDFKGRVDKKTFNWNIDDGGRVDIYPPIVAEFDNFFYQLNNFGYRNRDCFIKRFSSMEDVVEFAVSVNKPSNLIELSCFYDVVLKFNINLDKIPIFKEYNVKGKRNFEVLKMIKELPEELKKYIIEKNLSLKFIALYLKLKGNLRSIVLDFLKKEKPSISRFRNLLNTLFDYSRLIDFDYYDEKKLNEIVKKKNREFFDSLNILNKLSKIMDCDVEAITHFETCEFLIKKKVTTSEDIRGFAKKIMDSLEEIEEVFNWLKVNDIC